MVAVRRVLTHRSKSEVICYYSDQRDKAHGQKLSHQTSSDLYEWSAVVDDVAESTYSDRPGMSTVSKVGHLQISSLTPANPASFLTVNSSLHMSTAGSTQSQGTTPAITSTLSTSASQVTQRGLVRNNLGRLSFLQVCYLIPRRMSHGVRSEGSMGQ